MMPGERVALLGLALLLLADSRLYAPLYLASRVVRFAAIMSPAVLVAPLAAASATVRTALFFPAVSLALEHSGSAFVKWGQWAATRPDLLPAALCDTLSRLHARAPAHQQAPCFGDQGFAGNGRGPGHGRVLLKEQAAEPIRRLPSRVPHGTAVNQCEVHVS